MDLGPVPGVPGDVSAPAANAAAVVTYAADAKGAHCISGVVVSYSATPTGGNLQIADGTDVILNVDIPSVGPHTIKFPRAKRGKVNAAMTVTLAAGGATISGKMTVLNHWKTRAL